MIGLLTSSSSAPEHCNIANIEFSGGRFFTVQGQGQKKECSHFKDFLSEVEFMMTIYFMISYRIEKFHPLTSLKL